MEAKNRTMGKYFYLVIADTTKSRTEWEQQNFIKVRCLTDIAGHLTRTAQNNKTDLKDMRLYIADSKRHWDEMANLHYDICRAAEIEREKNAAWWDLSK